MTDILGFFMVVAGTIYLPLDLDFGNVDTWRGFALISMGLTLNLLALSTGG